MKEEWADAAKEHDKKKNFYPLPTSRGQRVRDSNKSRPYLKRCQQVWGKLLYTVVRFYERVISVHLPQLCVLSLHIRDQPSIGANLATHPSRLRYLSPSPSLSLSVILYRCPCSYPILESVILGKITHCKSKSVRPTVVQTCTSFEGAVFFQQRSITIIERCEARWRRIVKIDKSGKPRKLSTKKQSEVLRSQKFGATNWITDERKMLESRTKSQNYPLKSLFNNTVKYFVGISDLKNMDIRWTFIFSNNWLRASNWTEERSRKISLKMILLNPS